MSTPEAMGVLVLLTIGRFFEYNTPFADGGQMFIYSDGGSSAYSTTLTEITIGL